jgi:hypothetical protein
VGLRWLDLFREGDNNTLQHRLWDGRSWTRWEIIGTRIDDTPSAISWDENWIDVLALGTNGQLLHKHFPSQRELLDLRERSEAGPGIGGPHRGWDLPARGNTGLADALGLFREHETQVQGTRLSSF